MPDSEPNDNGNFISNVPEEDRWDMADSTFVLTREARKGGG